MEGDDTVDALTATVSRLAAEHEAASAARRAARERLRVAVVKLADTGAVNESDAAKLAGVTRQTIRVWRGKQDHQNRPIKPDAVTSTHGVQRDT